MKIKRERGFTLIELLVVIGIISILLAILIPVVSSMRITAQNAASTAQVQRISSGIQLYYNEFRDYPGILHNSVYANGSTAGSYFQSGALYANFTQSEDAALSLMGGMRPASATSSRIIIDTPYIGNGPVRFNPPKKYQEGTFMRRNADDLPGALDKALNQQQDLAHLSYCTDSPAPEFLDLFGSDDRRPVLYIRANPGANAGIGNIISDDYNPNVSYNLSAVKSYLKPYDSGKGDVLSKGAGDSEVLSYFTGSSNNVAKFAGGYQLISAGVDRKFGTPDDIRFGPGGGQ